MELCHLNIRNTIFKKIHKIVSILILVAFIATSAASPAYAQVASVDPMPSLPAVGVMVHLSPEFTPAHLQGIIIHPDNALQFDFLIHKGDQVLEGDQRRSEYKKLVKYFLASLTIPDEDQWVNLSPYEKDRIIKDDFGKTEMGRDLLAQDYMLKQITSSLIYPEDGLGKKFWDKVYERAWKEYHTTNIPVNTFNKVWIVPDQAIVYESGNSAYILKSHLKLMLEEDYLSMSKHVDVGEARGQGPDINSLGSQVIRAIILPELEKEVNEGKNFANLRQMYSGMILATWYKKALKESLLGKIYSDKAKIAGLVIPAEAGIQSMDVNVIYRRYLKAFKKGVFNYIKEDVNKYTKEAIPRKYFSGGFRKKDLALIVLKRGEALPNYFDRASLSAGKIDKATIALQTNDAAMAARTTKEPLERPGRLTFSEWLKDTKREIPQDLQPVVRYFEKLHKKYPKVRQDKSFFLGLVICFLDEKVSKDSRPNDSAKAQGKIIDKLIEKTKKYQKNRKILRHLLIDYLFPPDSAMAIRVGPTSPISKIGYGEPGLYQRQNGRTIDLSYGQEFLDESLDTRRNLIKEDLLGELVSRGPFDSVTLKIGTRIIRPVLGHPYSKPDDQALDALAEMLAGRSDNMRGSTDATRGGIDLNSANLDLQIKRDGRGVPLSLAGQDMAQLSRIQGFEPEIIEISPAVNVPIISELQQKLQASSV